MGSLLYSDCVITCDLCSGVCGPGFADHAYIFTGVVPTGCHAIICIGHTSTRIKSGLTLNDVPAREPIRLELYMNCLQLQSILKGKQEKNLG